jgi:hypothetical protein
MSQAPLVERDRPPAAVGAREAAPRPADARVELVECSAQPVAGHRARALLDVAVEQDSHARPERCDQLVPELRELIREQVPGACRIGEQDVEFTAVLLVDDRIAAALELQRDLARRRRAHFGELVAQSRLGRTRRRREEIRNPSAERLGCLK